MPILSARDVSVRFGGIIALDRVSSRSDFLSNAFKLDWNAGLARVAAERLGR